MRIVLLSLCLMSTAVLAQEQKPDPTIFRDCADCPEMKIVPAGSFVMGADESIVDQVKWSTDIERQRLTWETPRMSVTFAQPFALGVFEVTRDQFEVFVKATGRKIAPGCTIWKGDWIRSPDQTWDRNDLEQRGDHPVVCIDWVDAQAYADWLTLKTGRTYYLPGNAQWEYAYRAGSTGPYFWGDDPEGICDYGNVADAGLGAKHKDRPAFACQDGFLYTAPVGMKKPNPWGFYDMTGNVWEWIADCWVTHNKDQRADGAAIQAGDCKQAPLRGGAYGTGPKFTRSSSRGGPDPRVGARQGWIGFRVAALAEKKN